MTMPVMSVERGDITHYAVDAVVNAANESLLGGGGVDGAIHRTAGPALLEACRRLNGCRTGDAKITPGYGLPAKYVIHAVGPVWHGGGRGERELLAGCYRRSLELASEHHLSVIAFPCISTGVYRFPKKEAAAVAVKTVGNYLNGHSDIARVIFVCFSQEDVGYYQDILGSEQGDQ